MEYTDFASALHPFHYLAYLGMAYREADTIGRLAKAIGVTSGAASHWRTGRRRMSKAVLLLYRLVAIHGFDALFHGELAQTPNKPAQESSQVPKPKRTRKRKQK